MYKDTNSAQLCGCDPSANHLCKDHKPILENFIYKDEPLIEEIEKIVNKGIEVREFASGATRDVDTDKLDFEGFDSPLVNKRYAQYMHFHRRQKDGSLRGSDNWQKGIDSEAYAKSLVRHVEDFRLQWDGFSDEAGDPDIESTLCAILFNAKGILFEILLRKKGLRS